MKKKNINTRSHFQKIGMYYKAQLEQKVDVIEHLSLFLYTKFFLMNFSFGNNISIAIQI